MSQNTTAVHLTRSEVATIISALESTDSGILEEWLDKEMEWPIEKRTAFINGYNNIKPSLIQKLSLIVMLPEGGS